MCGTCTLATGKVRKFLNAGWVRRVSEGERGWQVDSPHSPNSPCSCNVVGTRATLDVLSSEHPGQLPPQTLLKHHFEERWNTL